MSARTTCFRGRAGAAAVAVLLVTSPFPSQTAVPGHFHTIRLTPASAVIGYFPAHKSRQS
jgi:hypothetical protein